MKKLLHHPKVKKVLGKLMDGLEEFKDTFKQTDKKKVFVKIFPYVLVGYLLNKVSALYHLCQYGTWYQTLTLMGKHMDKLFLNYYPSFRWKDILVGGAGAGLLYFYLYCKKKNAKKFRQGEEYGSARWSA